MSTENQKSFMLEQWMESHDVFVRRVKELSEENAELRNEVRELHANLPGAHFGCECKWCKDE